MMIIFLSWLFLLTLLALANHGAPRKEKLINGRRRCGCGRPLFVGQFGLCSYCAERLIKRVRRVS